MKPASGFGTDAPERPRFDARRSPATAALIGIFVLVFVASWFDTDHWIFLSFAKIDERVREGELWRLFTASFLHAGVLHLWFNGTALASLGPPIERAYGKGRYLVVFLVGGAVGMGASALLVPQPSVGASAGIFALLGALLANGLRSRSLRHAARARRLTIQVLLVVGVNLAIGFLASFIDNAAHVGGLAGGFALGLLLREREPLFPAELGFPVPIPVGGIFGIAVAIAFLVDLREEASWRGARDAWICAYPCHRVYAVQPAIEALRTKGIEAFARSSRFRSLFHFFAPYVPIEIFVPRDRAGEAAEICRAVVAGEAS